MIFQPLRLVHGVVEFGHQIRRIRKATEDQAAALTKAIKSGKAAPMVKKPISVSAVVLMPLSGGAIPER